MNMKTLGRVIVTLTTLLITTASYAQITSPKKFDYSILENKTLYIPTYEASSKFISKMKKRGKYKQITEVKRKAEHYNEIWKEAMAESSYDATNYEIKAFNRKRLIKDKDENAVLLNFYVDEFGNKFASLYVTHPKSTLIANTLITGLDLSKKNDIRLIINMLNESLNAASELYEEGKKVNTKGIRSKYKERLVNFYDEIDDKILLVPRVRHKNPKKAKARNADLREALKSWNLSQYEFTTTANLEAKRVEGDPDSYYWKSFPIYTSNPLITYHYNLILSTASDEVLVTFLGKKRLKPATLDKIQNKIVSKAERFKKRLNKG